MTYNQTLALDRVRHMVRAVTQSEGVPQVERVLLQEAYSLLDTLLKKSGRNPVKPIPIE